MAVAVAVAVAVAGGAMVLTNREVTEIKEQIWRIRKLKALEFDKLVAQFLDDPKSLIENKNWIELLMRSAGYSYEAMAEKIGTSRQDIQQTECREPSGSVTIKKMQEIAAAADCDFVYAFVPRGNETIIEKIIINATPFLELEEVQYVRGTKNFTQAFASRLGRFLARPTGWGKIWGHKKALAKKYNWRLNEVY